MSLAMGRLPAILVGQIPVVTTTDRGGGETGDGGQRASRPEYGIEKNLSKYRASSVIVPPLGEKKRKEEERWKKKKKKIITLDLSLFLLPPPREKKAASPRKIILEEGIPYQGSAASFIGPYNGVISSIKRDR